MSPTPTVLDMIAGLAIDAEFVRNDRRMTEDYRFAAAQRMESASVVLTKLLRGAVQWTHVNTPPKVGGTYVVGGYVSGPPRHFEVTFATCILTLDGPSWSHRLTGNVKVPIEYWVDLPPHPEWRPS